MADDRPPLASDPHPKVALFVTCMVDALYPRVAMAAARLLERYGADVVVPAEQTCCGQPAFNAGYREDARAVARHFLEVFEPRVASGDIDAVVAPSGSCTAMVRHYYDVLFDAPGLESERPRCRRLARATYELTEFLVDVLGAASVDARVTGTYTYHPCCHLLRELHVDAQPRRLLASLPGARSVELPEADACCGFGGLFAVKHGPISTAMGRRKARNVAACGADVVAVNDAGCMTQLNGILTREGQQCRAIHIAELLSGQIDMQDAAEGDG